MKKIVTHINPDLDAITSLWLIKRFLPSWEKAAVVFVHAGGSYQDKQPDEDVNILHVDTGLGKLDHHQQGIDISAAELTWQYILKKRKGAEVSPLEKEVLDRVVKVVTEVDYGRDLSWPEAKKDRFEMYLHSLIYGIKRSIPDDHQLVDQGLILLDGLLKVFKDKVRAEQGIAKEGIKFNTPWGKAIALKTGNERVLWTAQVKGYILVVKYDEETKKIKIYSRFDSKVDLTAAYQKFRRLDPQAHWFLHATKKLLLISRSPQAHPSVLSLEKIIAVLKK